MTSPEAHHHRGREALLEHVANQAPPRLLQLGQLRDEPVGEFTSRASGQQSISDRWNYSLLQQRPAQLPCIPIVVAPGRHDENEVEVGHDQ